MTPRVFFSRMLEFVLRRGRDRRLDEELRAHLDLLTDEYRTQGLAQADAARAARRALGQVDRLKEDYRAQRGLPALEALLVDVRLGLRLLRRDRAFTVVAVAVLSLGIGVNTMLFTILNAHTLRGLPIDDAANVVHASLVDSRARPVAFATEHLRALETSTLALSAVGGFTGGMAVLTEEGHAPERLQASYQSAGLFAVISPVVVAGRLFDASDDTDGGALVALISDRVWHARYGASTQVLDRPILIDRRPARIVGVFAERSRLPLTADIWMPLAAFPRPATSPGVQVIGRLQKGHRVADAREELSGIANRTRASGAEALSARVVPINQRYFGRVTDTAWLAFLAVGGLVVVIACANVANLMIDRSVRRTREVAIRSSLGASRARVMRQLLIESCLLAALGGIIGLGIALAGVRVFAATIPANVLPYWFDYTMDWQVVASLIAVSATTVLGFGLIPSFTAARVDIVHALKARAGAERRTRDTRWTTILMTAEIALTMIVLTSAMLGVRRADPVPTAERHVGRTNILTASLSLTSDRYETAAQRIEVTRSLVERLNALPGVTSTSFASFLPLTGAGDRQLVSAGAVTFRDDLRPQIATVAVGPDYFGALGLSMTAGHELSGSAGRVREAIVNEPFVARFLAGASPLGVRIALRSSDDGESESLEIVGVAPTLRQRPIPSAQPIVYLPYARDAPETVALMVRSDRELAGLLASMRAELLAIDRNVPLDRVRTMAQVMRDADWNARVSTGLITFLSGMTVLLSMAGLYAVTTHAASRRAAEIGIRMAFGARPSHVVRLMWRRAGAHVLLGITFGVFGTIVWGSIFASGQPGLRVTNPGSLALAAGLLIVVSAIATLIPVCRAARVDPIATLRVD